MKTMYRADSMLYGVLCAMMLSPTYYGCPNQVTRTVVTPDIVI